MKIAFVVTIFPAISETFILRQITGLIDRGHEVDIYANRPGDEGVIHETVARYELASRTYYLPKVSHKGLRKILGICTVWFGLVFTDGRKAVKAVNVFRDGWKRLPSRVCWSKWFGSTRNYDVIHCHFATNGVHALWWRKIGLVSGKIVTTFHGYDINCRPECYQMADYDFLFNEGDAFTVNSDFTQKNAKSLGCPEGKILQLPMGLNVQNITFQERNMNPGGEIRLLTVARLVECKGIEYAIRAFAKLAAKRTFLRYDIVGDGVLRQNLEHLTCELGLINKVRFLGWKTGEEVRRLYDEAHLFVLPGVTATNGQQEAQGLVLQEAQASGLPVIATNIGGIPESVVPGKSAFLVPEKDPDTLAERIAYLIEHPEIWPQMGRAGRAHVEANYNIDRLNDQLVAIYRGLLNG